MLVLRVLPLWSNSLFEQMVVGLGWKFRCRCDVVLYIVSLVYPQTNVKSTNVDSPELLYRIEADDFLEKIVPVVTLCIVSQLCPSCCLRLLHLHTLPVGGLVNQRVQVLASGCLTLKFSASWKTVTISLDPFVAFAASGPVDSSGLLGIATSAIVANVRGIELMRLWKGV